MTAKRQTERYKRIERQLTHMRDLAFGRPQNSPYSDADYLRLNEIVLSVPEFFSIAQWSRS